MPGEDIWHALGEVFVDERDQLNVLGYRLFGHVVILVSIVSVVQDMLDFVVEEGQQVSELL